MKLLMEQWRKFINEDPMGFVHQLAKSGKLGMDQTAQPTLPKPSGREIKDAFRKHADHEFLSTLQTVHWGDPWGLEDLHGKNKDELSTTMAPPGEPLNQNANLALDTGLLVKGRITLAANNQDQLYSGIKADYAPEDEWLPDEKKKKQHRAASSGLNKRPMVSKDYSRYDRLKKGNEFGEKKARSGIPYVLDQSTWKPMSMHTNEALVDNWRAVAVVVTGEVAEVLSKNVEQGSYGLGKIKQIFGIAMGFNIPIIDSNRKTIWSSENA